MDIEDLRGEHSHRGGSRAEGLLWGWRWHLSDHLQPPRADEESMEGFVDVGRSVEVPVWTDQSGQLSRSPTRR